MKGKISSQNVIPDSVWKNFSFRRGKVFNPLDASDKSSVTLCDTFHYLF